MDILKFLLAIAVIGIHTSLFINLSERFNFLSINGLFRIAVPIFLIISGYYFPLVSVEKWKLWLKRIALLYIFWMIIYLPFYAPFYNISTTRNVDPPFLLTFVVGYFHLWYVAAMFFAGLILFQFRSYSTRKLIVTAVILYSLGAIIQYVRYFIWIDIPLYAYRNFLFFALPMMTLGVAIAKHDVATIKNKLLFLILGAALLILFLEVMIAHRFAIQRLGFDMYFSLLILCPTLFVFAIKNKISYPTKNLAFASSVFYFSHAFFVRSWEYIGLPHGIKMFLSTLVFTSLIYISVVKLPEKYRVVF